MFDVMCTGAAGTECTIWYMTEEVEPRPSPKAHLLDRALAYFSAQGLGEQSLRQIAAALGTSHRMLIYHFGSRDGLLVAVAEAVEARTRLRFEDIVADHTQGPDAVIRQMWDYVADPALGGFERLFFALYGRGLQGDASTNPLLSSNIEGWLAANDVQAAERGFPADLARAHARLGIAVIRGLLLDLLATGDLAGATAALDVFAQRYAGRWWEDASVSANTSSAAS